jgi:hypothetical protein
MISTAFKRTVRRWRHMRMRNRLDCLLSAGFIVRYYDSSSEDGGIFPTVDSSSSLSSGYEDFFANSFGLSCISTSVYDVFSDTTIV